MCRTAVLVHSKTAFQHMCWRAVLVRAKTAFRHIFFCVERLFTPFFIQFFNSTHPEDPNCEFLKYSEYWKLHKKILKIQPSPYYVMETPKSNYSPLEVEQNQWNFTGM